jgi:hypothetical protein
MQDDLHGQVDTRFGPAARARRRSVPWPIPLITRCRRLRQPHGAAAMMRPGRAAWAVDAALRA